MSHTNITNIHDKANLMALCALCHFAFDHEEWTFFPLDMTSWIKALKADSNLKSILNSRRDIGYQRILLLRNPRSKAYQDLYYRSAFANAPTQTWVGEPGVLILRNHSAMGLSTTNSQVLQIIETSMELYTLWKSYTNPCCVKDCELCKLLVPDIEGEEDAAEEDIDSDENDDEEEGDEEKEHENEKRKKEKGKNETIEKETRDDEKGKQKETENEIKNHHVGVDDNGISHDNFEIIHQRLRNMRSRHHESSFTTQYIKQSTFGRRKVKFQRKNPSKPTPKPQKKKSRWTEYTFYGGDKVPHTHHLGYTWANCTAKEIIETWQAYRAPALQRDDKV